MKIEWIDTKDRLPPEGKEILCGRLTEFVNAPWSWSFWTTTYRDGYWGRYSEPDKWALIPEPPIPMNAEHKKALKRHAREKARDREQKALDRKYGD